MQEKILKILNENGHLVSEDLTVDEKQKLNEVMVKNGATRGYSYHRFYKDGYKEWEMAGIDDLKKAFCEELSIDGYTNLEYDNDRKGSFMEMLLRNRVFGRFADWMAERGMLSHMTVRKRFRLDDWRKFERIGIKKVLAEL